MEWAAESLALVATENNQVTTTVAVLTLTTTSNI